MQNYFRLELPLLDFDYMDGVGGVDTMLLLVTRPDARFGRMSLPWPFDFGAISRFQAGGRKEIVGMPFDYFRPVQILRVFPRFPGWPPLAGVTIRLI